MSNYIYSTSKGKIKELNEKVFITLMRLGFQITSIGTIYFKNIIITSYINHEKDLSYNQCINILSKMEGKCPITIKSDIFKCFESINQEKYLENFSNIFEYDTDMNTITPLHLYESFSALLQLKCLSK